ncbi:hypothetical protein [Streptomyces avidinii]|uniref:Uncharacterized protein n=1 Tax=Streptomyces avidinii TaxID=1895 RepID=A0ABS4KYY6_STRAV|nr:hypothetical protein [Streptomyces avidinii]MBP2035253.1 hypothetical protein [Streptomyces avidinii]GGZ03760.1 hypothetical protein GCM10010343_32050 [Streptomyces avidinii]
MSDHRITLTMLGAPGSGKTTYLHGMYATLSMGLRGYFMYATDPDTDLDLAEAWEKLCADGRLPAPNNEDPIDYEFVLRHGVTSLVDFDCQDFRGGAATERGGDGAPADIPALAERLERSDSIFLVLDGQHVGRWVADDTPAHLNPAADPMKIARFSRAISNLCDRRRQRGEPSPSIVVLVTKADLLGAISGLPTHEALEKTARNLSKLVKVIDAEGVTAMLCPVQLGSFGGASPVTVDPALVDPQNLHHPMIFALLHYLDEGIVRHGEEHVRAVERQLDEQGQELAGLRSGGRIRNYFKKGEINRMDAEIAAGRELHGEAQARVTAARVRAEQLVEELRYMPIYRSGKLQIG